MGFDADSRYNRTRADTGNHDTAAFKRGGSVTQPEIVYRARRFHVEQHVLHDRDGEQRKYQKIVLPGAAVILPILADGSVVLIRNYRFVVEETLLELPAGMLDPGEPPLECARRELIEETGYRAGKIEPLVTFYSTPGICNEAMHTFVATELVPGEAQREPGEHIDNLPMKYEEALAAIGDGRIKDAKTIVSLLYYDRYIRKHG
jgi:ADP-ribose pyrophosphatase